MHVRKASLAGIVIAALAAFAGPAAAECAMQELGPQVITRAGAKIPADGGILVGWTASTGHKKPAQGDPSQGALGVLSHKVVAGLLPTSLAPGLTVYRPKPAVIGRIAVQDTTGTRLDVTFDKAKGAALPAPDVTAVALTEGKARSGQAYAIATVSVAAVPDAAVALVIYGMQDEEHVPLSFGPPAHDKTGATTVVVFTGAHNCAANPPAMRAPTAGDEVALAWVDAFGRLSPLSQPVTAK